MCCAVYSRARSITLEAGATRAVNSRARTKQGRGEIKEIRYVSINACTLQSSELNGYELLQLLLLLLMMKESQEFPIFDGQQKFTSRFGWSQKCDFRT